MVTAASANVAVLRLIINIPSESEAVLLAVWSEKWWLRLFVSRSSATSPDLPGHRAGGVMASVARSAAAANDSFGLSSPACVSTPSHRRCRRRCLCRREVPAVGRWDQHVDWRRSGGTAGTTPAREALLCWSQRVPLAATGWRRLPGRMGGPLARASMIPRATAACGRWSEHRAHPPSLLVVLSLALVLPGLVTHWACYRLAVLTDDQAVSLVGGAGDFRLGVTSPRSTGTRGPAL
jgi:hypothetical protein